MRSVLDRSLSKRQQNESEPTALLVCTVIAVLFLSAFLRFDASIPVALLFSSIPFALGYQQALLSAKR
jgi:hypothetical protein